MPVQRSDFAGKQHNLALGSQESTFTELQIVGGLWERKVRCIGTIPNTSRCHGVIGADRNGTGPENVERAREKAACWHNPNNILDSRYDARFVLESSDYAF